MKTIIEDHKLIAEFMGAKDRHALAGSIIDLNEEELWLPYHGVKRVQDLKYHMRWDWLIPKSTFHNSTTTKFIVFLLYSSLIVNFTLNEKCNNIFE